MSLFLLYRGRKRPISFSKLSATLLFYPPSGEKEAGLVGSQHRSWCLGWPRSRKRQNESTNTFLRQGLGYCQQTAHLFVNRIQNSVVRSEVNMGQIVVVGVGGCGRRGFTGEGELRWQELVGEWVNQAGVQTPLLIMTEDVGWDDLIKSYRRKTTCGKQHGENT